MTWSIRLKALLMLMAFAANFTVFCHCATAQKRTCCCEKKSKPCHSAQAVHFNLAEKLVADHIQAAPLPVIEVLRFEPVLQPVNLPAPPTPGTAKHPPPDILTLQQRLLI